MINSSNNSNAIIKVTKKRKRSSERRGRDITLLAMCIPAIIKVIIFAYIPMVGVIMAFQRYIPVLGVLKSPFVGLNHFEYLFKSGNIFRILKNTITLNLCFTFFGTIAGVVFGILLFEISNKLFVKVSQTIMFFPFFIAWPVVATILGAVIGEKGMITLLLTRIFDVEFSFYDKPQLWTFILTFMYVWKSAGIGAITYYAVLMNMDKELFEAASIDGASRFRRIIAITLPSLKFMVIINVIMSTANILRMDFTMIYFLTNDSSLLYSTTEVIESYMFRALRASGEFEPGVATGLIQGVAGFFLAIIANKASKLIDKDAALF